MKTSLYKILYVFFIFFIGIFPNDDFLASLKKPKSEVTNRTIEEEEKTEKEKEGESILTQKFQKKRKIGGGNDFFTQPSIQTTLFPTTYYLQTTTFPKNKFYHHTQALYLLHHNLKIACFVV